jgi:hypothetical protein
MPIEKPGIRAASIFWKIDRSQSAFANRHSAIMT